MKPRWVLGLDLGSSTFKLAIVEVKDSVPALVETKILELPPEADRTTRVASLKKLMERLPVTKFAQIVSLVEDPFACLQQILVPQMPAGELPGAIQWELQRYLAVAPEETLIDYEPIGEVEISGAKKLKLLAAAVPTETIKEHLALLAQAKLTPTQLTLPAAATVAWMGGIHRATGDAPTAILIIGERFSEFLVAREGTFLFSRKIPVAGGDVTRGITGTLMTDQGQMALTPAEAEMVKRSHGFPLTSSSQMVTKGISGTQLMAMMRGSLERLTVEVERSLAFYGESMGNAPVSELILVGGGANLKGLPEWLQTRLGIRVTLPNPAQGIPVAGGGPEPAVPISPSLVPVLGAALGAGKGLNLLPMEMKAAARAKVERALLTGILTAVIVGMVLLRVGMGVYQWALRTQMTALQFERGVLEPQIIQAKVAVAAHEKHIEEPRWEELFRQLSQAVSREMYLTVLAIDGHQVTLRGKIRDLGRPSDMVLADFIRALRAGILTQVRLGSTRQVEGSSKEWEFEVVCLIQ